MPACDHHPIPQFESLPILIAPVGLRCCWSDNDKETHGVVQDRVSYAYSLRPSTSIPPIHRISSLQKLGITESSASFSAQLLLAQAHTTIFWTSTGFRMNCSLRISMSVEIPLMTFTSVWPFRFRHLLLPALSAWRCTALHIMATGNDKCYDE